MDAGRHSSFWVSRWSLLGLWLVLTAVPIAVAGQEDCSVSGERWNDISLFRRCLAESGIEAWESTNEFGRSVLHNAAFSTENPAVVSLLLAAGADPNATDDDGETPLGLAAWNGNPMVTSHLLRAGADPNIADNEGGTPLYTAVGENSLRAVQLLLGAGADPNAVGNDGWSPLHSAARLNAERIARLLLDAGANPNTPNGAGMTPLHNAAREGAEHVADLLLDANANPNAKDNDGYTPLHWAAAQSSSAPAIKLLLDEGADLLAESNEGRTPLHSALRYHADPSVVSALLEAGAAEHLTPLQLSALQGDTMAVRRHIENGEDPNKMGSYGWAPLHFAVPLAGPTVVTTLLAAGADPNQRTASGANALVIAARQSTAPVVSALLEAGAELEVRDTETDWTPLHLAARRNADLGVVVALLDAGADVAAKSGDGQYPVDFARANNGIAGTSVYKRLLVSEPTLLTARRSFSGELRSGDGVRWGLAYYDEFSFFAMPGQLVLVTMESEDLDSYLIILGDDGTEVTTDDDGGEGLNARVTFHVQTTGQYTVLATSAEAEETGRYVIQVEIDGNRYY